MDKTKDNQTEKLLGEIYNAFDKLRNSLGAFDAFKIAFVLLYYKHFEEGYEIYAKATYTGESPGKYNDTRAVRLYEHIYETLTKISAEAFGLQFTKINPDNVLVTVVGNEQKSVTKESKNDSNRLNNTQDIQSHLAQIPQTTKREILEIFNSQDLPFKDISPKDFESVVNILENKCIKSMKAWNYVNPSLGKLVVKLLNPQSGQYLVYPFCGLGQMLITAMDHICKVSKPYVDSYVDPSSGRRADFLMADDFSIEFHDKNIETLALAKLRIAAKIYNLYVTGADSNVQEFHVRDFIHDTKAGIIFLNPPFRLRHPDNLPSKVNIDGSSLEIPKNHGELFELLHNLQRLSDYGRMSVVIPIGVLFSGGKVRKIRKFLTESDYLEAVIQLPEGIFSYTSIPAAILVINKNKSKARKHKTLFAKVKPALEGNTVIISDEEINRVVNIYNKAKGDIDAIVTLEEIQQQDYDLSPSLYIGAFPKEIEKLVDSEEAVFLEKISTIIRGKSRKPDPDDNNGLPFITTKDLAKDVIDPYPNYDKCFLGVPLSNENVFDKKCILVSLVGNALKPTIFDPEKVYKGEPDQDGHYHGTHPGVLLGRNIAAIIPNEQIVDFEYLYYQLYSPIVKRLIEMLIIGAGGIPRIALQHFAKIVIPVPKSIEDQRRSISQQKLLLFERENAKLEVVKSRLGIPERKQEAEFEIVRYLAHNIKPKINIVRSPIMAIYDFLEKENLLDKVVSTGRNSSKETARGVLNIAKRSLGLITNVLDITRDIVTREIKKNEFQETNIFDLFENKILPFYKNKTYDIILDCKDKEIEAYLHIESFIDAIGNIIRNAEMHAFSDDIADPELRFEIYEDVNAEEIIIDYTNNGIPFPSSMNADEYLSFGKKSNNSKGDGLGGAWIGKVIEAHDGTFEIIRDKNPIHFKLTFPKGV